MLEPGRFSMLETARGRVRLAMLLASTALALAIAVETLWPGHHVHGGSDPRHHHHVFLGEHTHEHEAAPEPTHEDSHPPDPHDHHQHDPEDEPPPAGESAPLLSDAFLLDQPTPPVELVVVLWDRGASPAPLPGAAPTASPRLPGGARAPPHASRV